MRYLLLILSIPLLVGCSIVSNRNIQNSDPTKTIVSSHQDSIVNGGPIVIIPFGDYGIAGPGLELWKSNHVLSVFTISTQRDTVLIGKKGVKLTIRPTAFEFGNANFMTLKLEEYLSIADMLIANLHSMSATEPLESAGMIHLSSSVPMKKDSCIQIEFPRTLQKNDDLQLFNAREQNGQLGMWQLSAEPNPLIRPIENRESAEFSGGRIAFTDFLNSNLQLPETYVDSCFNLKLDVAFWFNDQGKIDSLTMPENLPKELEIIVLQIFSKSPNWLPALRNNIPIASMQVIPIVIKMECPEKKVQPKRYNNKYGLTKSYQLTKEETTMNLVFSNNQLGWINCDRFLNLELTAVSSKIQSNVRILSGGVILNELNSIAPVDINGDQITFQRAKNKPVTMILFGEKENEYYYAFVEVKDFSKIIQPQWKIWMEFTFRENLKQITGLN